MFDKNYLLLSTQTALLGHISPFLRAATVDFDEKRKLIILYFFYDIELNDQLFELASCAATEIDLGPDYHSHYEINNDFAVYLKYPQKIPIQGTLVFFRNEPNAGECIKGKAPIIEIKILSFPSLRLSIQQALLGKVTPNLRDVEIIFNKKNKEINFYLNYDGCISKEEYDLAKSIAMEACRPFSGYRVNQHIERVDFPEKILRKGGRLVYLRYEGQYDI